MTKHQTKGNIRGGSKSPKIKLTAETARNILVNDLAQIPSVGEWAKKVKCTPYWLGKCLKTCYGMGSKEMLRTERYNRICSVIRENPQLRADRVADLVNRKWNGKHLCDFLWRNYQTNFTELKVSLLAGGDEAGKNVNLTE